MKIAIVQIKPAFGDVIANVRTALAMMKSVYSDLYVLPELFSTGYNFTDQEEVKRLSEPDSGFTVQEVSRFANEKKCYVVFGFAENAGNIYNSSALVGPSGLIGLYRKIHLYYRENLFFSRGNLGFPVFDLPFGKLGMMVCYDWIYPEAARTLALKGAQVIAHPSNLVLPYCPDAMITRCLENRIFAATANRVGEEDRGGQKLSFVGKSEIVSPRGEVLTRLGSTDEGIAVVDVELSEAHNKQMNEYNNLFRDLAPDAYK